MVVTDKSRHNLTPAAEQILEGLLDDLVDRTLVEARARSVGKTIDAREVIEAFEQQTRARVLPRSTNRLRRLLRIYVVIAFISAASAALILLADIQPSNSGIDDSERVQVLIVTTSAILAASMGLLSVQARRIKRNSTTRMLDTAASAEFLESWRHLETLLRMLSAERLGSSSYQKPFGHILNELHDSSVLKDRDFNAIKEQLRVRNRLAHGDYVPRPKILTGIEQLDDLVIRLSARL